MDLKETGWESVNCIYLSQDREQWWVLVNTIMNLRVPYKAVNFLNCRVALIVSRRTLLHRVR
jgi:hypothetical protein